jgi:hypothetical protein
MFSESFVGIVTTRGNESTPKRGTADPMSHWGYPNLVNLDEPFNELGLH